MTPRPRSRTTRASPTVLRDISLNPSLAPTPVIAVKDEMTQARVRVKEEVADIQSLDGLAHLSLSVTTQSVNVDRCKREGSVLSVDDARSTIDAFFGDHERFTSDKDNKLRFWQSLCIEFGLVKLEEPGLSVIKEESDDDGENDSSVDLPALPTSLNKVKQLLKEEAHVNLKDYMDARTRTRTRAHSSGPRVDRQGNLSHLVFPSAKAMIKYTRKHRKFAKINVVKSEWLNPLLRTFNRR